MTVNPLRFPGSKSGFAPIFADILRINGITTDTLVEPYGGGMSVSLELLSQKRVKRAIVCERDPLIHAFWTTVRENPDYLVDRISSVEVNLETWQEMQTYLVNGRPVDLKEKAFAFLFLNRTCFSGIITGGPIGGYKQLSKYKIDCRFYRKTLIDRVQQASPLLQSVELINGDAVDLIRWRRRPDEVWYLDPPYVAAGRKLYRYYYEPEEHKGLWEALQNKDARWFLSYDVCRLIKTIYLQKHVYEVKFEYSARKKESRPELLIASHATALPESVHAIRSFKPTGMPNTQRSAAIAQSA
ncbi:DNA adenine methylase [Mesorhizobium sp. J8]|uniref:DNA adenine methylase n=1 Tax=Mesorhizobium sp. J8 TaxID=2777475 RepID=UPI001916C2B2|nr:DNA adenine methylase [Mesorhizobium sp. J8]BCM16353.1 hypothetical protein MJ8_01110 [Mesorhizobium sp. J8]